MIVGYMYFHRWNIYISSPKSKGKDISSEHKKRKILFFTDNMENPFELTTVHEAIQAEVRGERKNLETENLEEDQD